MSNRHVINLLSAGGFILCNQKIAQTATTSAVILQSMLFCMDHSERYFVNICFITVATATKTVNNTTAKAIANLTDAGICL